MSAITEQQWFLAQTNIWHPIAVDNSEQLIAVQEPDQTIHSYRPGTYVKVKPDGTEFTIRTLAPVGLSISKVEPAYGIEVPFFLGMTLEEKVKLFKFRNIIKVETVTILNEAIAIKDLSNLVFDYLDLTLSQALFIAAKKINIMAREDNFTQITRYAPLENQKYFWSRIPFQIRPQPYKMMHALFRTITLEAMIPTARAPEPQVEEFTPALSRSHYDECRCSLSHNIGNVLKIQTDPRIEELIQEETRPLETLEFLINPPPADPMPANLPPPLPLPQPQSLLQVLWQGICAVFECISACLSSLWQCLAQ